MGDTGYRDWKLNPKTSVQGFRGGEIAEVIYT